MGKSELTNKAAELIGRCLETSWSLEVTVRALETALRWQGSKTSRTVGWNKIEEMRQEIKRAEEMIKWGEDELEKALGIPRNVVRTPLVKGQVVSELKRICDEWDVETLSKAFQILSDISEKHSQAADALNRIGDRLCQLPFAR